MQPHIQIRQQHVELLITIRCVHIVFRERQNVTVIYQKQNPVVHFREQQRLREVLSAFRQRLI